MTDWIVWFGELTHPRRLRVRGSLFLSGSLFWLSAGLTAPMLVLVFMAFARRSPYGEIIWNISPENFLRLAGFGAFGWTADYLWILARSAWMASVTTLLSVGIAYPLAFWIALRPPRTRNLWFALVVIPFCTNLVIRTYAWMLILSNQMPPARFLQWLGWLAPEAALYPGAGAVFLGMVASSLPFAALPIYTNVERLDWSLVEAAQDLYGGRWAVFRHAIFAQTQPGLLAGIILTFIPAMGAFVVPDLLGGARTWLVGNLIQQQFGPSRDWPFGAAVSLGLMVLTLAGLFLLRRLEAAHRET